MPCGNGRVALELARRGANVVGVDLSERLLEDAREAAAATGAPPDFVRGDMRDWAREASFDLVLCLWGSIGYSDDADAARAFRSMRRSLRPGGRLVLDTPVLDSFLGKPFGGSRASEHDGLFVMETPIWSPATGRVDSSWVFAHGGFVQRDRVSIRMFTYRELAALLTGAGFGRLEPYGSRELTPFSAGDRLYLVATAV